MDNPFYDGYECYTPPSMRLSRQHSRRSGGSRESVEMELGSSAGVSGSQTSMALDLHDCQVTLKVKDESANKRSDTSRRHQLLRQKPVEDDVMSRCSCASRFLCNPPTEGGSVRAKSSVNLKSPCHHSPRAGGSCSGRGHIPKMTAAYRSQSFSPTCSFNDPKRCFLHESTSKIFCIDGHGRTNLSSENIRLCCCEKFRGHLRRHSPGASPRSERREQGPECLVHRGKDSGNCAVAKRSSSSSNNRSNRKMEGSLSAEERHSERGRRSARSSSFSPTRDGPSRDGSFSPGCGSIGGDAREDKKGEPS